MTWLESYQDHLEAQLAKGGKPKEMEAAIQAYNTVHNPTWILDEGYRTWAVSVFHTCMSCGQSFSLEPAFVRETLHDEKRCMPCLSGNITTEEQDSSGVNADEEAVRP